jgi:hypothetical protein
MAYMANVCPTCKSKYETQDWYCSQCPKVEGKYVSLDRWVMCE